MYFFIILRTGPWAPLLLHKPSTPLITALLSPSEELLSPTWLPCSPLAFSNVNITSNQIIIAYNDPPTLKKFLYNQRGNKKHKGFECTYSTVQFDPFSAITTSQKPFICSPAIDHASVLSSQSQNFCINGPIDNLANPPGPNITRKFYLVWG